MQLTNLTSSYHFTNLTPNTDLFHPSFQAPTTTLTTGTPLQGYLSTSASPQGLDSTAQPIPDVHLTNVGTNTFEGRFTQNGETFYLEDVSLSNDAGTKMIIYSEHAVIDLVKQSGGGGCQIPDPNDIYNIPSFSDDFDLHKRSFGPLTNDSETYNHPILIPEPCPPSSPTCNLVEAPPEIEGKLRRRGVTNGVGRDCPVALIADKTFTDQFGEYVEAYMLSILSDVDGIYRRQLDVGMSVLYLYVVRNDTDPTGLGVPATDAGALLNQVSQAGAGGGICSTQGLNTGIVTAAFDSNTVTRATMVTTVAHEFGHGMGSSH
ncbi:hypothetical protein HK097_003249, partial [Rhizophlyctis rosea]